MSDDKVTIEVDGKTIQARKGQMLIEATDAIGAYVPRFCYHDKLSVAANCRMCLVEVEKVSKPLPACATPVTDGMKVFTKSAKAISAQKATMEFLLINHPLDCPICDQGGECELQDLAMGFGRDVSRYQERKRVVKDKDIGPLVSTDMTRCIHCTRCVRFGEEITGHPELGTTERGENMKIGTYIEKSIDHELSANIIDLCPVGALNNKPYRYSARAWEMVQRESVSAHDCVGSNLYAHVLRGTVKRIVPRPNEAINETWISDRDRYSYEGVYSSDRLLTPRVRRAGKWQDISWEDALQELAEKIQSVRADRFGILASAGATVEESRLLAQIAEHVGTANVDHRLRQQDFSDQDADALFPWLGCEIADIERCDAIFVAGSSLRKEAPILAHRVRKAALAGARIAFANPENDRYFFDVAVDLNGARLVELLAGVAVAASSGKSLPKAVSRICKGVSASGEQASVASMLRDSNNGLVLIGNLAIHDEAFSAVRALAAAIAELTGCRFGIVSEGPNAAGAHLAGLLPHRSMGGTPRTTAGKNAAEMIEASLDALLLFGIEPDLDLGVPDAVSRLSSTGFVAALTAYDSETFRQAADLLLPIGTFAETSGTFVNCEGRWQSFSGIANPVGESRPGWKVLRVLGNLLDIDGFEYLSSEDVRDELLAALGSYKPDNRYGNTRELPAPAKSNGAADVPMYAVDPVVRRATALQLTPEARRSARIGQRR
ncbi:MAG: NADH-quinone oxidoreductase subunit NuoG [Gammaproteobacteria bacterium]|nr:NADH-quinone oxidoreductase subunit NuoG [Gammaproteobacteria bacterium]